MNTETSQQNQTPKIFAAMAKAMNAITPVSKDRENKDQKYKFRSIDDVFNSVHGALAENEIFILYDVKNRTVSERKVSSGAIWNYTTVEVEYRFTTTDGSFVSVLAVGEGADNSDKSTAKAMSYAFKTALLQIFAIPTEELNADADNEQPEFVGDKNTDQRKSNLRAVPNNAPNNQASSEPKSQSKQTPLSIAFDNLTKLGVKADDIKADLKKAYKVESMRDLNADQAKAYTQRLEWWANGIRINQATKLLTESGVPLNDIKAELSAKFRVAETTKLTPEQAVKWLEILNRRLDQINSQRESA